MAEYCFLTAGTYVFWPCTKDLQLSLASSHMRKSNTKNLSTHSPDLFALAMYEQQSTLDNHAVQ